MQPDWVDRLLTGGLIISIIGAAYHLGGKLAELKTTMTKLVKSDDDQWDHITALEHGKVGHEQCIERRERCPASSE